MEVHEAEACQLLDASPELQQYYDWARANGVIWTKLHYPTQFPPGYEGTVATQEIGPYETVIKVPNHMVLSYKLAAASELKPIFDQHPEVFSDSHYEYEDMVLTAYLLHERAKGEASFWYPFLRVLPSEVEVLYDWSSEDIEELQDPDLQFDANNRYTHNCELWTEFNEALKEHPDLFPEEMISFNNFHWAWKLIMTRCFGKYSPSTSFGPVAELLNHSNTQTVYIYGTDAAEDLRSFVHFEEDEDQDDHCYEPEEFITLTCQHLLSLLGCSTSLEGEALETLKLAALRQDYVDTDKCRT